LRQAGEIPAVVYGKAAAPISLAVQPKDIQDVFSSPWGRNSVVELNVEGRETLTVLLTDYQYHPVSRSLLHADFVRIALDAPVSVDVPFELVGKAEGVAKGGVLRKVFRKLPVSCLPQNIPTHIDYDVTELGLDEHVPASALALPEGVSLRMPENQTVCAVVAEKKVEEEAAAEGEGEAAAAPAEGAAEPPPTPAAS